jgi:hypothetical protein
MAKRVDTQLAKMQAFFASLDDDDLEEEDSPPAYWQAPPVKAVLQPLPSAAAQSTCWAADDVPDSSPPFSAPKSKSKQARSKRVSEIMGAVESGGKRRTPAEADRTAGKQAQRTPVESGSAGKQARRTPAENGSAGKQAMRTPVESSRSAGKRKSSDAAAAAVRAEPAPARAQPQRRASAPPRLRSAAQQHARQPSPKRRRVSAPADLRRVKWAADVVEPKPLRSRQSLHKLARKLGPGATAGQGAA